jgi:hypothetical protein
MSKKFPIRGSAKESRSIAYKKKENVLKEAFKWATEEQLREIYIFSQGVVAGTLLNKKNGEKSNS